MIRLVASTLQETFMYMYTSVPMLCLMLYSLLSEKYRNLCATKVQKNWNNSNYVGNHKTI